MTSAEEILARVAAVESNFHSLELDRSAPVVQIDGDTWLQIGARKYTMDDETRYCDEVLLAEILKQKSLLDGLDPRQVKRARAVSNFFEVKSAQFMNRAAVKIANLDALFNWKLCQLSDQSKKDDDLLYFVDVFGGPGGCSEYVLWRNAGWHAKGFGFTTKGDYEFQTEMFRAGSPEALDTFYGPNDNGNLFDPENLTGFIDYVMAQTDNLGAHLIMCDGGFYVKNNCQEVISKQLYLILAMLALTTIRQGGNAILKVFDLYTPFSVGLVYILSKSYGKISIVKPVSSRSANSERYIICENRLKQKGERFGTYLFEINQVLWEHKHLACDILHIVLEETMQKDASFYNFIRNSNNELARRQITGLKALIAATSYSFEPEKVNKLLLQTTLWRRWKLDHKSCLSASSEDRTKFAADYTLQFVDKATMTLFASSDVVLNDSKSLKKLFGNPRDWSFLSVDVTVNQGKAIRTIFVSKGNGNVFYYDCAEKDWRQVKEYRLVLTPRTIVYGEIAEEISAKEDKQKIVLALHIIDAIMLGGENVRNYSLGKRNALCTKFAKALNRPLADRSDDAVRPIPVRCKQILTMIDLDGFFNNVSINQLTGGTKVLGNTVDRYDSKELARFYIPRGLLFIRHSQTGAAGSKGGDKLFDFNKSFSSRLLWAWSKTSQIYSSAQCFDVVKDPKLIYRQDFDAFIAQFEQD